MITAHQVRLIGEHGEQLGVMLSDDARSHAYAKELDLVEVAPLAEPPVARVMDFGKYRYELEQKAKLARRNQTRITIKEIRLRPKIGLHDFETKAKRATAFLRQGEKVKVVVLFRGREREHPERGSQLLERFSGAIETLGVVEGRPLSEGRSLSLMIAPRVRQDELAGSESKL